MSPWFIPASRNQFLLTFLPKCVMMILVAIDWLAVRRVFKNRVDRN